MGDYLVDQQECAPASGMNSSVQYSTPVVGLPRTSAVAAAPVHEQSAIRDTSQRIEMAVNDGSYHEASEAEGLLEAMPFPRLSNDTPSTPKPIGSRIQSDEEDEEPATARSFPRSTSPGSTALRNRGAFYEKVGEEGVCQMHRFSLYETASRFYLVGMDVAERKFRILKIDRTADSGELSIAEDDIVYTRKEMNQLLNAVDDGNKSSGGMKLKCSMWGLLGFIRFTEAYYMLLVTKRSQVAMIGGHYIYQIDATELISLTMASPRFKIDRDAEETRFIGILNNLDLTRSFYFSYSYDITHTLQHNILRERRNLHSGEVNNPSRHQNSMFVWNHHLLEPAASALKNVYDWCLPIVHGFVDQASKVASLRGFCSTNCFPSSQSLRTDSPYHPHC